MFKKTERTSDDFETIKKIITRLDTICEARKIAKDYIENAQENLRVFNNHSPVYQALNNLINKNLYRHI